MYEVIFLLYEIIYILKVYSMHYALNKTQMFNNFLQTKQTLQKMHYFFFRELQFTTVLPLIRDSSMR